jgi:hypothetical protein
VPRKWICPPFFKLYPTAVHFLPHLTEIMAQSSRAVGKGQRKGRNFPTNVVPPPSCSSGSASVPSAGSGATASVSNAKKNSLLARQQAQYSKYPLWKYVTIHQGLEAKLNEGRNVL